MVGHAVIRPRATFSTSGPSYMDVGLTTVHHLCNVSSTTTVRNSIVKCLAQVPSAHLTRLLYMTIKLRRIEIAAYLQISFTREPLMGVSNDTL